MEGGSSRYASSITALWSNVPQHVRASFSSPANLASAPLPAPPLVLDSLVKRAKAAAAATGLAPESWSDEPMSYYGGQITLAPYKRGQTHAYNYPDVLVPRGLAYRVPLDMYVDPVFQTSDPAQRLRMVGSTLFPRLQQKTTILLVFSGQPLSGLWTGLQQWLDSVGEEFLALPRTQVLRLHAQSGWFNRRTHQLTKFQLRRQVEGDELFSTFVYRGKWKPEYVRALHLYNDQLPVVLLVDRLGYVRWHAVGLPSQAAAGLFRSLARKLAHEKTGVA